MRTPWLAAPASKHWVAALALRRYCEDRATRAVAATEGAEYVTRRISERRPIDASDTRLLEELRKEPRATSKALAATLGMTEVAVASRLKGLERDNVFRVVAQLDFRALDYGILAIIDIRVSNGKIRAVAEALALVEGVGSVSVLLGDPPIIVQVQARGLEDLSNLVLAEIATIDGVEQVETNIIAQIAKWSPGSGLLEPRTAFGEADE